MLRTARWRLASLGVSQTARVLADTCLGSFALLADGLPWLAVVAVLLWPAIVLAPVNGAVANSLPRRWVLARAAGFSLAAVGLVAVMSGLGLACLAAAAVGAVLFRLTQEALLPAAATDSRMALTRVNGWIAMGTGAALTAGLVWGGQLVGLADQRGPVVVGVVMALNLLALLAAWPVWFAGDVARPEPTRRALGGFFGTAGQVLRDPQARKPLLFLAGFHGLVIFGAGLLLMPILDRGPSEPASIDLEELTRCAVWMGAGLVLGSLLAGVQTNPWRSHGLVAFGATGLCLGLGCAALGVSLTGGMGLFLCLTCALIHVPLMAAYQASLPAPVRGHGMALAALVSAVFMAMATGGAALLVDHTVLTAGQYLALLAVLAAVYAAIAWRGYFREAMELLVEWLTWPVYRIRGHGPELVNFPQEGPVLIIANHSAWFDPIFIAKVMPRRLTAMMTSQFYDKPVLRWFSKHVVHAIRVQASAYRREAPELAKAIAALDKGDAVLIFPEGAMRRRENLPLKLFGQGVWHILSERPHTPVVVCWIEGNWGCYFSYFKGPPTVNKRLDFWRRIDVAVDRPQQIDPALLTDQRETRRTLMRMCLETRRLLGLEPLRLDHLGADDDIGDEPSKPAGTEEPSTAPKE